MSEQNGVAVQAHTTSRTPILDRIRAALGDVTEDSIAPVPPAPRRDQPEDLLELFVERVVDYRAEVIRVSRGDLESTVAGIVGSRGPRIVPPGLSFAVPGAVVDDGTLTARELDLIETVVTEAAVGVAETGTIVLDHQANQGRRAISLVPDVHVCVVLAEQVVVDVPDAVERLDPARPQTWISGPSATSDIELDRVEGVHGPRTLIVLLVE
jgi:L-lactate dehydrogenase complex protein LldG